MGHLHSKILCNYKKNEKLFVNNTSRKLKMKNLLSNDKENLDTAQIKFLKKA